MTMSKRTGLQTMGAIFMVLLASFLVVISYQAMTLADTDLEKSFLLGVSFLVFGEMVFIYIKAFGPRAKLLYADHRKVGTIYDPEELYKELVEITGESKRVIKDRNRIDRIMREESELYRISKEAFDESSA